MLTAATWVFALLLVIAGVGKVTEPAATAAVLQFARLPSDERMVRVLGIGEVALGLAVISLGGRIPSMLLALAYAAFAGFADRQRRQDAGCGCFGATTAPATTLHVSLNVAAAAIASGAAIRPGTNLPSLIADAPFLGLLAAALLIVAASLGRLLLTEGPRLTAAVALFERSDA